MGSSIAWFSTEMRRTASSARVSRLSVSYDYDFIKVVSRKSDAVINTELFLNVS